MIRIAKLSTLVVMLYAMVALLLPFAAGPASAADQTVTLTVEKMYCASCPLTVQAAIQKVPGVKSVKVDYKTKSAVITFDAAKTTPETVAAASTNIGYPARVVQTGS